MRPVDLVWIIVHTRRPLEGEPGDLAGHAFGPFAGLAEIAAFEQSRGGRDDCHTFILPMVVPDDATVIVLNEQDAAVTQ